MKLNSRLLVFPLLITLFIYTIIRLYLYSRYYYYGDEAEYINNAWRVYSGSIPYKDFWLLFPPAEVYFPAFLFKLLGVNINTLLYSNLLSIVLTGLFSFLVLNALKCNRLFSLVAAFLL